MRNTVLKTMLNGMYFSGLQAVSGFWTGGVGAILTLHHVRENNNSMFAPNSHLQITPGFLDKVLTAITNAGYELVSLDQLHEYYHTNKIDPTRRLIAITLDDGYRDNLVNAAPVFKKHNAPTLYSLPRA